jgi:hypothetical protein
MTRRRRMLVLSAAMLPLTLFAAHAVIARRGSCPMRGPDANALEAQRHAALEPLRGASKAPSRRALGFDLEVARAADLDAWAAARGGSCAAELGASALRCTGVFDAAGPIRDLFARFDPRGRLVALDIARAPSSSELAIARFTSIETALERDLGAPSETNGELTTEFLDAAAFRQAAARHRFSDELVDITVTTYGQRGAIVREQYRAIPAPREG